MAFCTRERVEGFSRSVLDFVMLVYTGIGRCLGFSV